MAADQAEQLDQRVDVLAAVHLREPRHGLPLDLAGEDVPELLGEVFDRRDAWRFGVLDRFRFEPIEDANQFPFAASFFVFAWAICSARCSQILMATSGSSEIQSR